MGAKPYALYNENDDHAADWLENLITLGVIAPGIVDRRSIEDLRGDDLRGFRQVHLFAGIGVWSYSLRRAGISDDTAVWTGSCPCQPFSAAGKGAGMDDERHLWPAVLHLLRECRPDIFLGEQVASTDGLGWLDLVQTDLEAAGYAIGAVDTCSAGSGAPHIRQRLRFSAYDIRSATDWVQHAASDRRFERWTKSGERSAFSGCGSLRLADQPLIGRDLGPGFCRREQGELRGLVASDDSAVVGLGHADGHGAGRNTRGLRPQIDREDRESRSDNAGSSGIVVGLDNSLGSGLEGFGCRYCTETGQRQRATGSAPEASEPCRLAHDDSVHDDRAGHRASSQSRQRDWPAAIRGFDDPQRLAYDDDDQQRQGRDIGCPTVKGVRSYADGRVGPGFVGRIERPGPTNGIWRDADWLFCRDDKWRAVEPGTFPLVDGATFRVGSGSTFEGKSRQGMLKGYGNAIDAEATRVFVEACADFFVDLDARRVKADLIGDLL
ncbi:DNA cytosine methyltransferase [Agrobacterium tumefaciens]|uniref:DNA cytosine methyltransferase n=1 Tax=Agrobacterium tumefaciens TaxID=358 RepID=UPI001EED2C22